MLARTHLAFGALTAAFTAPLLYLPWVSAGIITFASLFPDVDHEGSTINKIVPVTKVFAMFFKHRGFFHSVWPALIGYFVFAYIGYSWIGFAAAIGYCSHLLSDCITKEGVNFLHPIAKLKVEGFVTTGTMYETIIFFVVLGLLSYKVAAMSGIL